MSFQIHQSWITSLKAKIRDYPSCLEPDLKSRKAFIYLSCYTLTYSPLTSILPSQRALNAQTYPPFLCIFMRFDVIFSRYIHNYRIYLHFNDLNENINLLYAFYS